MLCESGKAPNCDPTNVVAEVGPGKERMCAACANHHMWGHAPGGVRLIERPTDEIERDEIEAQERAERAPELAVAARFDAYYAEPDGLDPDDDRHYGPDDDEEER